MTMSAGPLFSKFKISRRGRKLQLFDDQRTLLALPKDVPERTWAEILQKEETELMILDIREEIMEDAMRICYERYMERQNVLFTAHCAAKAWLKLIDWYFYRHDPGEDPSARPPCFIPKRAESWIPDEMPDPSPKDSWGRQDLVVVSEEYPEEGLVRCPSTSSIDMPVIEDIPKEYWFPGKVNLPGYDDEILDAQEDKSYDTSEISSESDMAAESELLQKVTDYSTEQLSPKVSNLSALKNTTPEEGSLHGAGDSVMQRPRRVLPEVRGKAASRPSVTGRSKGVLPPLDFGDSRSRISVISDCRLRNLRLDMQYEVSSEKVDTPPAESAKRR